MWAWLFGYREPIEDCYNDIYEYVQYKYIQYEYVQYENENINNGTERKYILWYWYYNPINARLVYNPNNARLVYNPNNAVQTR